MPAVLVTGPTVTQNSPFSSLAVAIELRMLHQTGGFEVRQFNGDIEIYIRQTPVAVVTKM